MLRVSRTYATKLCRFKRRQYNTAAPHTTFLRTDDILPLRPSVQQRNNRERPGTRHRCDAFQM